MKRLLLFLAFGLLMVFAYAQDKPQQRIFSDYEAALRHADKVVVLDLTSQGIEQVGSLTLFVKLEKLKLSGNPIKNLPDSLYKLRRLETVEIDNCPDLDFEQAIAALQGVGSLSELSMANNGLQFLPKGIENLRIKSLNLSENELETLPPALAKMKKLRSLDISYNLGLQAEKTKVLASMKKLKKLKIEGLREIPFGLVHLGRIKSLSLTLYQGAEKNLRLPKNLKSIYFSENEVDYGVLWKQLLPLEKLETISISNSDSVRLTQALFTLPRLKEIWIANCLFVEIPNKAGKNNSLRKLTVQNSTFGNVTSLGTRLKNCIKLSDLRLRNCQIRTLPTNLDKLASLRVLDVSDNEISSLFSSITEMKKAQYINLWNNPLEERLVRHIADEMKGCRIDFNYQQEQETNTELKDFDPSKATPPLNFTSSEPETYFSDGGKGGVILTAGKTKLDIPPDAFLLPDGSPAKGKIRIEFTDYSDPFDIFISGIPMAIGSPQKPQFFESGGMFSFRAFQDSTELSPNPESQIEVTVASANPRRQMNLYLFVPNRGWQTLREDLPYTAFSRLKKPKAPREYKMPKVEFPVEENDTLIGVANFYDDYQYIDPDTIIPPRRVKIPMPKTPAQPDDISIPANIKFRCSVGYYGKVHLFNFFSETDRPKQFSELNEFIHARWKVDEGSLKKNTEKHELIRAITQTDKRSVKSSGYVTDIQLKLNPDYKNFRVTLQTKDSTISFNAYPFFKYKSPIDTIIAYNKAFNQSYTKALAKRQKKWQKIDSIYTEMLAEYEQKLIQYEKDSVHALELQAQADSVYHKEMQQFLADLDLWQLNNLRRERFYKRSRREAEEKLNLEKAYYHQPQEVIDEIYSNEAYIYNVRKIKRDSAYAAKYEKYEERLAMQNAKLFRQAGVNSQTILRSFRLEDFGIVNCDALLRYQQRRKLAQRFINEEKKIVLPQKTYLLDQTQSTVLTFDGGSPIIYEGKSKNLLISFLRDGRIGVLTSKQFKLHAEKKYIPLKIVDVANMNLEEFRKVVFDLDKKELSENR